jgi:hypothetical protein
VERGDELDRQRRRDGVEPGGAHTRAADVELTGRHLREDLGPASQPDGLDADPGRRQMPVGHDVERRERVGGNVADSHRRLGLRRHGRGRGQRQQHGDEQSHR